MEVPKSIGKYDIIRFLGGGMSNVFRAIDTVLGREVAVKVLTDVGTADPETKARFLQEARIASALMHDNIVRVYDFGEIDERPFMVMEWVDGESLRAISQRGPIEIKRGLEVALQIARALKAIHAQNIVHRDVKPDNIFIDHSGRVKLMDFGIAKSQRPSTVTQVGFTIGTPYYMAPEHVAGKPVTTAADIWAFGLVLFEMFSGVKAINAESIERVFYIIISEPLNLQPLADAHVPEPIVRLIQRCTEKNPADRIQSFTLIANEITRMLAGEGPEPDPGSFTQVFRTAPPTLKQPVPPPPPASGSVGEYTRMFQVGGPSPADAARPAEPAQHVALKITACSDLNFLGQTIRLDRFPFRIGRPGRDYALAFDSAISRDHFEIDFVNGGFIIRDLGSANGTFVEESQVGRNEPVPLLLSKRIRVGTNTEFTFLPYRSDELPNLCGTLIRNRYRLLELLRESWRSAVYKGQHEDMKKLALVKILAPSLLHHSGYKQQFQSLAQRASELSHPHITRVLDFGETELAGVDRTLCVVTEYLEGGSLSKRALPPQSLADCVEKVGSALDYAHAKDIVHGGIKPGAIVFDGAGNPYLTDFALPVLVGGKSVIASSAFMAPEQWAGESLRAAADQYSLAATIYAAITGVEPFVGQENPTVRQRNLLQGAIPAHDMAQKNGRPSFPAAVSEVLRRGLSANPEDRFPSVLDLTSAFRAALNEAPAAPRRKLVFISYHRADSSLLSLMLKDQLAGNTDYEVFLDSEQQDRTGQFPPKIQRKIENCDAFVCLLGKSTLKSSWVNQEIQLAHSARRPMLPVFQESFKFPKDRSAIPPHVRELIDSGGERVQDLQNRYVRESIKTVADMVRQLIGS
jgi:serine/threonine protein kinase